MLSLVFASALVQIEVRTSYDANRKVAGHVADERSIGKAREWLGKQAPAFTAKDLNGKPVTLKSLAGKPVAIFFLDKECPCCARAKVYVDRLHAAYGAAAHVVGFVNGSAQQTMAWTKKNKPLFRVLPDPGNRVALTYKAEFGMACRMLDKNGKILLSYPGYSTVILQNFEEWLAAELGVQEKGIKTFPAPDEITSGCPLIR